LLEFFDPRAFGSCCERSLQHKSDGFTKSSLISQFEPNTRSNQPLPDRQPFYEPDFAGAGLIVDSFDKSYHHRLDDNGMTTHEHH
jgi:hypothetical protein